MLILLLLWRQRSRKTHHDALAVTIGALSLFGAKSWFFLWITYFNYTPTCSTYWISLYGFHTSLSPRSPALHVLRQNAPAKRERQSTFICMAGLKAHAISLTSSLISG